MKFKLSSYGEPVDYFEFLTAMFKCLSNRHFQLCLAYSKVKNTITLFLFLHI
jgi:hypothetical protein